MKKIALIPFVIFLTACATHAIDTYNKRVGVFEISINETLKTAKLWLNDPAVSVETKTTIRERVQDISQARLIMQHAENIGDYKTATGQLKIAQTALTALREIVANEQ